MWPVWCVCAVPEVVAVSVRGRGRVLSVGVSACGGSLHAFVYGASWPGSVAQSCCQSLMPKGWSSGGFEKQRGMGDG
jgi:hypothetical protein